MYLRFPKKSFKAKALAAVRELSQEERNFVELWMRENTVKVVPARSGDVTEKINKLKEAYKYNLPPVEVEEFRSSDFSCSCSAFYGADCKQVRSNQRPYRYY